MNRPALTVLMAAVALLAATGLPAHGQNPAARTSRFDPFFGFAIGGGIVPRVFEPNCVDGWEGSTAMASIELRLGSDVGPFGLEARTGAHTELGLGGAASCFTAEPIQPDGVQTVRSSPIDRGPFLMTDIRARYTYEAVRAEWLVSAGGGWVWQRGVPLITGGLGVRIGSDLRAAFDADVTVFRVPWDETTAQWLNAIVIEEIASRSEKLWQVGVSLRVGFEVPIARDRTR